jgi:HK97 family phage prohead protease
MKYESKRCTLTQVKFAETDTETMTFEGYGAVFGNVDSYGDVIAPGAFADTLTKSKDTGIMPAMLMQHGGAGLSAEDNMPIGKWTDIFEDEKGLKVTGELAGTEKGRDMHTLMKMGAIDGLSIGYMVDEFKAGVKASDPARTLTKLNLVEISPVTFPANGEARIHAVKSIDEIKTLADVEDALRDVGLSNKEAKNLIAKVKDANQRDADESETLVNALKSNNHIFGNQ